MARLAVIVILALVAAAQAQLPTYAPSPCKTPGSYHLSCYAKAVTPAKAIAAKNECFKAWNNPACKATVAATYTSMYGCDTAITYQFASDACLMSYQAQEKTNTKCVLYSKSGLADKANRQDAKVALKDYTCPFSGPCYGDGFYHMSCYKKSITPAAAKSAKLDCFKAWNNASCKATVAATWSNMFGCETAILYNFTSLACRASYQAQEKTNTKCVLYNKSGLGDKTKRLNTTVAADYQCPYDGPCNLVGAYHISCYAAAVTPAGALAAKTECFKAWNQPTCKATVQIQATSTGGCDTFIAYSFATDACRASYQGQEKTNTKCVLYNKSGLGDKTKRNTTTYGSEYDCPVPSALPK